MKHAADKQPTNPDATKVIEIKLTVPAIDRGRIVRSRIYRRIEVIPQKKLIAGTIVIIVSAVITYLFIARFSTNEAETDTTRAGGSVVLVKEDPDYDTLLPAGKTANELGGWTRISPPQSNPVHTYNDTIGSMPINVSQQPLPASFRSDTEESIAALAADYLANEKITTGGTTVFIGTSASGPQSVIFHKDKLLILIKSDGPLSSDQWAAYINNLQ